MLITITQGYEGEMWAWEQYSNPDMEARMIPLGMIGSWVIQHQVPQCSARPVGMQCPFSEVELKDSLNPNNICSDAIRSLMN